MILRTLLSQVPQPVQQLVSFCSSWKLFARPEETHCRICFSDTALQMQTLLGRISANSCASSILVQINGFYGCFPAPFQLCPWNAYRIRKRHRRIWTTRMGPHHPNYAANACGKRWPVPHQRLSGPCSMAGLQPSVSIGESWQPPCFYSTAARQGRIRKRAVLPLPFLDQSVRILLQEVLRGDFAFAHPANAIGGVDDQDVSCLRYRRSSNHFTVMKYNPFQSLIVLANLFF